MFRTVIIREGEKVKVKNNWLVVMEGEGEHKIPIEDIYSVVIDNQQTIITLPAVNALAKSGAHILLCDDTHIPAVEILPLNSHYRPLNVLRKQLLMSEEFKDDIWEIIIKAKIYNQAKTMEYLGASLEKRDCLYKWMEEVEPGDIGNREAISAKLYFHSIFGSNFLRFNDDAINGALNYGYAIIRSAVAKTLVAYGYNCVIGIHHINEYNPFNLADDLMEPLRPLVDRWVDENAEDLFGGLTSQQRKEIINLTNNYVLIDNKKMKVINAIDRYIASFSTVMTTGDISKLKIPYMIRNNFILEEWNE
ncbi:MAG: type II CRISPR-associated endonuclease Cas1 [Synergistaceae bacterium]